MRLFNILTIMILIGCNQQSPNTKGNIDYTQASFVQENIDTEKLKTPLLEEDKCTVLVLPPYDEISNRGITPKIRKYLEKELSESNEIILIEFPLKQLRHVPYQNIFDKKYCKPIVDNVDCDVIIMSKIDLVKQTGQITEDLWNVKIRLYNAHTEEQINSQIRLDSLSSSEIKMKFEKAEDILITEIKRTVANKS